MRRVRIIATVPEERIDRTGGDGSTPKIGDIAIPDHALAAGVALLLWSCAVTFIVQPLVISQLFAALALPIPLAAWGAKLQQVRNQ